MQASRDGAAGFIRDSTARCSSVGERRYEVRELSPARGRPVCHSSTAASATVWAGFLWTVGGVVGQQHIVTFRSRDLTHAPTQSFLVRRASFLPVLSAAEVYEWGWLVEFTGTSEALRAAGVTFPVERDDFPGSSMMFTDEYGDLLLVRKHGHGVFRVNLSLVAEVEDILADPEQWRIAGPSVRAQVMHALERMRVARGCTEQDAISHRSKHPPKAA
jgi:hypothetical protein